MVYFLPHIEINSVTVNELQQHIFSKLPFYEED